LRYVAGLRAQGVTSVIGAMLESNLVAGSQRFPRSVDSLVYGQSITDGCIDWPSTERLVLDVAENL
jgi:3-deoxy-7-phosphoheptulonate synthase